MTIPKWSAADIERSSGAGVPQVGNEQLCRPGGDIEFGDLSRRDAYLRPILVFSVQTRCTFQAGSETFGWDSAAVSV